MLLHYTEQGDGAALVALHGAGVDHRDIEGPVERARLGERYRRIYVDLPAMGRSTADGLRGNDDVVDVLVQFLDQVAGGPTVLLGHSYGAYLARGVAARHPDLVRGLALVCPIGAQNRNVPAHEVVRQEDAAYEGMTAEQRSAFDDYFVVRTPETARRFLDHSWPGTQLVDGDAFGRIAQVWPIDLPVATVSAPTLIMAARHDSVVGYAGAEDLLGSYPNATLSVVADAGHALPHEKPELFASLLHDWARRITSSGSR